MLKQLEAVRENERLRVSRDLHDRVGQDLVVLSLELQSLKRKVGCNSEVTDQLRQIQEIVTKLDKCIHDFAWELRPQILDDLGLQAALTTLFEKWAVSNSIEVLYQFPGIDKLELPSDIETGLYSIVQESLNNISKHSSASLVSVAIKFEAGLLVMVIQDNGRGFDAVSDYKKFRQQDSLGLVGMHERAEMIGGILDISSKQNYGTTVKISLPVFSGKKGRYAKVARLSC